MLISNRKYIFPLDNDDLHHKFFYDKDGKNLTDPYRKLVSPLMAIEIFDKNRNKLDGVYTNILISSFYIINNKLQIFF